MVLPIYRPPTKALTIKGSADALVLRGLSLEDVTLLINEHLPEIVQAVEAYRDGLGEVYSTRSMDSFLAHLLTGFPSLVSHLIAHAADAPDEFVAVAAYPAGVQLGALAAIAELTLEDAGGLSDPSPALGQAITLVLGALSGRPNSRLPGSSGLSDAQ